MGQQQRWQTRTAAEGTPQYQKAMDQGWEPFGAQLHPLPRQVMDAAGQRAAVSFTTVWFFRQSVDSPGTK